MATCCSEENLIRPIGIAVYEVRPSGGLPGSTISIIGVNFSDIADKNPVTVDGLEAEVLSASDSVLRLQLPLGLSYKKAEVVVTTAGLNPDTTQVIISENPLAEVTDITTRESDSETIA